MTQPAIPLIDTNQSQNWQEILSDLITDPKELVQLLQLDSLEQPASLAAMEQFPLKVTRPYVASMEVRNWNDPLLRQVWPSIKEETTVPGFVADPLKESKANPVPALLHKYHGRVLLTVVPHCGIHCRYCFRRHFDYSKNTPNRLQWLETLDYISADQSIKEVILSGGDPLAVSDRHLAWLFNQLKQIKHITTVRIHTRLPIVIPQRLTAQLCDILASSSFRSVVVIHCNHFQELSELVKIHLKKIDANRVTLLNQSVLLAGINDRLEILEKLSRELFSLNVLPYYLHLLDKVAGAAHFSVSRGKGIALIKGMENLLPGYLVPRLVEEEADKPAKYRVR